MVRVRNRDKSVNAQSPKNRSYVTTVNTAKKSIESKFDSNVSLCNVNSDDEVLKISAMVKMYQNKSSQLKSRSTHES